MSKSTQAIKSFAKIASAICKVPYSIIAIKDSSDEWVISEYGIMGYSPALIVNPALKDIEIVKSAEDKSLNKDLKNFLKKKDCTFYAEYPLTSSMGVNGLLCILGPEARDWSAEEHNEIKTLTSEIAEVVEIGRQNIYLSKQINVLEYFLTSSTSIMAVVAAETFLIESVSKEFCQLMGFTFDNGNKRCLIDIFPEEKQKTIKANLLEVNEGLLHEFEYLFKKSNEGNTYYKFKLTKKNNKIYIQVKDITEKKKVNQTLIENEERYRRLSDFAFENIALYDNGKIVDCNSTFTKTFGYEYSEVKGMSLFHFFPRIYRELTKDTEPGDKSFETMCVRKDSSTFPAEIMVKTIESDGVQLTAIAIRDNTDRRKLENELLKSTLFQKAILDSSSFAIMSTDFNGLIKTFNKGAEKLIGINAENVVEKLHVENLHRKDEIRIRAKQLSVELGKPVKPGFDVFIEKLQMVNVDEYEWTYKKKNRDIITASLAVTTLKDSFGEITGYLFMGTDISDKKKAEAEIIDKSQMLNGIISHMPVIVFKADSEGALTQLIGKGLQFSEETRLKVVGNNIYEMFPSLSSIFDTAYEEGYITFVYKHEHKDEETFYETFIFSDLATKGGLIGFALDITDKTIAEHKLKDSAENLVKINKELDQFAYIVSHDLKAPLRGIATLSEYIEEDLGTDIDPDISHNMSILRNRAQRMQNLIDGILSYSRVGRIKAAFSEVKLDELVNEIISVINAPESFEVKIVNPLPVVYFNAVWLEQIFTNLISNAIKYHDKPSGKVNIDFEEDTKFFKFSVTDDGPGIPPEFHEKVFVIFQTLESRDTKESTGVGLAIVKKIIEEQGGSIWIESDGQNGSRFIFTLPKTIKAPEL